MRTGNNDNSDNKKIPPGYPSINGLEWQNKRSFSFEGHEFDTMQNSADFLTDVEHEREGRFFMAKNVTLMQKCITLFRELKPKNFVELGIHRGGQRRFPLPAGQAGENARAGACTGQAAEARPVHCR